MEITDFKKFVLGVYIDDPFNKQYWNITLYDKNLIVSIEKIKGGALYDPQDCYVCFDTKTNKTFNFKYKQLQKEVKVFVDDLQNMINTNKIKYKEITNQTRRETIKIIDDIKIKQQQEEWNKKPWYKKLVAPSF